MGEMTSQPEAITIAGAVAFFALLGAMTLVALTRSHVRYWMAQRNDPWVQLARRRR